MCAKSLDFVEPNMKYIVLGLSAMALTGCGGEHTHSQHQTHTGLEISSARIVPPFPGRDIATGYFEIANHSGKDDRLISASSPVSAAVEIHNHIEQDGVMKMRQVQGIDVRAGQSVSFQPGGYHLMFFETTLVEGQSDVAVTLTYENAPPVTLIVPLEGRGEIDHSKMDHSGH